MLLLVGLTRHSFACAAMAMVTLLFANVALADKSYEAPTLTFHVIAMSDHVAVLGGSLEGPKESTAKKGELIVQFYKGGSLFDTKTLMIDNLIWPKTLFKLPIPMGVDCYEIISFRTLDDKENVQVAADETAQWLYPGRCLHPNDKD